MIEYSLWGIVVIQGISIIVLGVCAWRESDARMELERSLWRLQDQFDQGSRRNVMWAIGAAAEAAKARGIPEGEAMAVMARKYSCVS